MGRVEHLGQIYMANGIDRYLNLQSGVADVSNLKSLLTRIIFCGMSLLLISCEGPQVVDRSEEIPGQRQDTSYYEVSPVIPRLRGAGIMEGYWLMQVEGAKGQGDWVDYNITIRDEGGKLSGSVSYVPVDVERRGMLHGSLVDRKVTWELFFNRFPIGPYEGTLSKDNNLIEGTVVVYKGYSPRPWRAIRQGGNN